MTKDKRKWARAPTCDRYAVLQAWAWGRGLDEGQEFGSKTHLWKWKPVWLTVPLFSIIFFLKYNSSCWPWDLFFFAAFVTFKELRSSDKFLFSTFASAAEQFPLRAHVELHFSCVLIKSYLFWLWGQNGFPNW